jgi:hypothetical protein
MASEIGVLTLIALVVVEMIKGKLGQIIVILTLGVT